jgi:hypothetical protein
MAKVTSYGVEKDQKIYGNCQVLSSDGILILELKDCLINKNKKLYGTSKI